MTNPQPQEKPPEQGKPNVPHGEPSEQRRMPERPAKTEPERAPVAPPKPSTTPTPG